MPDVAPGALRNIWVTLVSGLTGWHTEFSTTPTSTEVADDSDS